MNSLIGNQAVKAYLQKALKIGALHHTLLFCGLEGVGKSLFAKALAAQLLNTSESRLSSGNHPDLHLFFPESKSGLYPVEQIRAMIDEVHIPPFETARKVFILEDADRMQTVSANALLKTLEEPHPDTTIILIADSVNRFLPTILSRCIQLRFQPIACDEIEAFLQTQRQIEPDRAKRIARLSQGSLGHALCLLENELYDKVQEYLFSAMEEKIPTFQAIEGIEAAMSELEGIGHHKLAKHILSLYLMKIRDFELLRIGELKSLCYFNSRVGDFKTVSMAQAELRVAEVQLALERNIRFSACLEFLLKASEFRSFSA